MARTKLLVPGIGDVPANSRPEPPLVRGRSKPCLVTITPQCFPILSGGHGSSAHPPRQRFAQRLPTRSSRTREFLHRHDFLVGDENRRKTVTSYGDALEHLCVDVREMSTEQHSASEGRRVPKYALDMTSCYREANFSHELASTPFRRLIAIDATRHRRPMRRQPEAGRPVANAKRDSSWRGRRSVLEGRQSSERLASARPFSKPLLTTPGGYFWATALGAICSATHLLTARLSSRVSARVSIACCRC